ncbi:aminopeptidase [Ligilactobacillus sp. Marseille-Q7487]|uniref:aminopeptidase n=1 Tax=Ligilactobacillus sp. Marseille-Q7487 TaxID=3022128 RepID=UPI0024A7C7D2|nr:aminopeptidase [Ligilactobacillus sp. Marseille-Q7487]
MNNDLLIELSNTDSIASCEYETRKILYENLKDKCDEILFDKLGSIIFHKKGTSKNPLKLMFCAHLDEVGFKVRSISETGLIYLIAVGGVLDKSKEMQIVRITTNSGEKIEGILNVSRNSEGKVAEMYVDIGVDSNQEVCDLGIEIGNMVCFATEARKLNKDIYLGKAFDDRTGCYVIANILQEVSKTENDIYIVGTSSEEVGIRGAKTATNLIKPDIIFAIDVANNPETDRSHFNHRRIGYGPMIVQYDKTMAPNLKLVSYIKQLAKKNGINYQEDMFKGGGTDAGSAHLDEDGRLAVVLGIPLRYCHGSCSLTHKNDLNQLISLGILLARTLRRSDYEKFINYMEV